MAEDVKEEGEQSDEENVDGTKAVMKHEGEKIKIHSWNNESIRETGTEVNSESRENKGRKNVLCYVDLCKNEMHSCNYLILNRG